MALCVSHTEVILITERHASAHRIIHLIQMLGSILRPFDLMPLFCRVSKKTSGLVIHRRGQ